MPEAELARVDECDRSIPRRETIRGTHWQKTPFGCLDLASRNPSWQRSCATATTDRTYDRKRSDSHEQTLATRGPSTYGSLLSQGRRKRIRSSNSRHACVLAARCTRGFSIIFRPKRAWGTPDAHCTRSLVCNFVVVERTRVNEHTGTPGIPA